jgi:hypothetical protein
MSAVIQYNLFEPIPSETDVMRMDIDAIKTSCDKVRKSLFAKNNEICKTLLDISHRLEILERNICQAK